VLGALFCGSIEPVAEATNPTIIVNANAKGNKACFIDLVSPIPEKMTRFLLVVAFNLSLSNVFAVMIPETN